MKTDHPMNLNIILLKLVMKDKEEPYDFWLVFHVSVTHKVSL